MIAAKSAARTDAYRQMLENSASQVLPKARKATTVTIPIGSPHSRCSSVIARRNTGLVDCNVRFGSERSGMAQQSVASARRPSEARVGPLASFGNAAIAAECKPDTLELGV